MYRRNFLKYAALSAFVGNISINRRRDRKPLVLSTWDFGIQANKVAWENLKKGKESCDATIEGVKVIEADPTNKSVGLGGYPDRDGIVTLDACVMDHLGNAGSVCALEKIIHPSEISKLVKDKTPHVILSGQGALDFALSQGYKKANLLTEETKNAWQEWLKTSQYKPIINIENHDTIGCIAMDINKNLGGCCSTSGLAYKMHGRIGDSPIIGAGLYLDNEIGAATCTGLGEAVLKHLSSFLAVELMRQRISPQKACEIAINRIVTHAKQPIDFQVGIIAMNKNGQFGAYSIHKGFTYAASYDNEHFIFNSKSYY